MAEEKPSYSRAERLERQISLIGESADEKLRRASVLVVGVGGVGGAIVESLARAGIGKITVVDHDSFAPSNLNRQILCTDATVGRSKAQVAVERILSVNPACEAMSIPEFVTPENARSIMERAAPDFVCDAVDNVTAKISLIEACYAASIPVISCMGTGNKLDPSCFQIAPIEKTSVCPLARVMRYELKKRGISGVPVLFSTEAVHRTGARTPASVSYVPPVAGYLIGGYVIRRLAQL